MYCVSYISCPKDKKLSLHQGQTQKDTATYYNQYLSQDLSIDA